MAETDGLDLTGQMLIAMPGMGDPRFDHSVVYICAHDEGNTLGLIINKPIPEVSFADIMEQVSLTLDPALPKRAVHFGGPVETSRGFVLHSPEFTTEGGTLKVSETISMTATLDVLEALGRGTGPERALVALGYAGWGPGQLAGEIAQNAWLTAPEDPDLIFEAPTSQKWQRALQNLGVEALTLSSEAGRA